MKSNSITIEDLILEHIRSIDNSKITNELARAKMMEAKSMALESLVKLFKRK